MIEIVAHSGVMREAVRLADRVAATDTNVPRLKSGARGSLSEVVNGTERLVANLLPGTIWGFTSFVDRCIAGS